MTIISVTVKKGLASLEFDNPEQLLCENRPVLASLFYERGLKKGSELSPAAFCELLEQSETKRAKSRAVWLLSKKGYSSAGLRKKLNDKFIKKAVDTAIDFCEQNGFLNDSDYAASLARRLQAANKSRRQTVLYMQKEGLSKEDIENALSSADIDESGAISELVARKYKDKLLQENGRQKVVAALLRRGFRYEDIKKAISLEEFYE